MDRWQRLEDAILEIEQFARDDERGKLDRHLAGLESTLQQAEKRADEASKRLAVEREVVRRLEQAQARTRALLGEYWQRDAILHSAREGDVRALRAAFSTTSSGSNRSAEDQLQEEVQAAKDEALRVAASEGFVDVCDVLVQEGADAGAREPASGQNALHRAVSALGHSDAVLHVLVSKRGDVRARVDDMDFAGQTALSLAVRLLRVDRVLCLLSLGADTAMVAREDWQRLNDFQARQQQEATAPAPATAHEAGPPPVGLTMTVQQTPTATEGDALFKQGRYEDALAAYEESTTSWAQRVRCCALLDRHCDAIDLATRALAELSKEKDAGGELVVRSLRAESRMRVLDFQAAAQDFYDLGLDERAAEAREALRARQEDLYEVLALQPGASSGEVRKAFLKQCLRWHPDKNRSSRDDETRAGFMFKAVNDAHLVLMDGKRRREYDTLRAEQFEDEYEEEAVAFSSCGEEEEDDGYINNRNNNHHHHYHQEEEEEEEYYEDGTGHSSGAQEEESQQQQQQPAAAAAAEAATEERDMFFQFLQAKTARGGGAAAPAGATAPARWRDL